MDEHRIEMQYAAAVDRQNAVSDVGQVLFAILFFFFFFFLFIDFTFFVTGHVYYAHLIIVGEPGLTAIFD